MQGLSAARSTYAARAGRYPELDSLRGIAAFIVVLFHCWMTLRWSASSAGQFDIAFLFTFTPLRIVTAGMASVGLFFTLSGLVLALPWVRGEQPPYRQFLVKRFFRLYVPFAAAIALAAVIEAVVQPRPVTLLSEWFNASWNVPLTTRLVLAHLFMLGHQAGMSLNNVMWSLVHEARISMLFPFLVIATLARPVLIVVASLAVFLALSSPTIFGWLSGQLAGAGGPLWGVATLLDTLRYGIYFVAGLLMALRLGSITRRFESIGPVARVGLWCLAGALLLVRAGPYSDGFWMSGAVLLIALSLSSARATQLLARQPFRWLGRVSYSLYLVHLPVLLAVMHVAHGRADAAWLLAGACALALLCAEFFNRLVERPSQRLGQRLGAAFAAPRPACVAVLMR